MIADRLAGPKLSRKGAGLSSLTNKVALLFAGVVLVAFGVVYFYIVPQLRTNLEQQVMEELAASAEDSSGAIEDVMDTDDPSPDVDRAVQRAADDVDARVTLLGVQSSAEDAGVFYAITDSNVDSPGVLGERRATRNDSSAPTFDDTRRGSDVPAEGLELPVPDVSLTVADAAVNLGGIETGLGRSRGELVAQAAAPLRESPALPPEWVAVYSRPIADVNEAVGLIQRQVLVAGVLAVVVALAGGWLVARAVARRVRRLESAAQKFAEGKAVRPLPVDSEDELGQLTRTFNEMQEQLARVDRSRRDFIANASHELRTPIFSLGGFAELLQDEDLDPETRERFLASMREQIDRLQRLAADLLDLSRLDAGVLEIHPREADVAEVIDTVVHEFAPVTAERHTSFAVDLPPGGLEAHCDPDRVAQIVRILLDNAIRHNPEGTPVALSAARRNGAVEVSVSDRGRGIDAGAVERVFERFYTADAARGSGLGLAIARELAERMGGRIELRSAPGDTVFTVALPVPADRDGGRRADGALETAGGVTAGERA
jgi:signal transduction histidine kinase